MSDRSSSAFLSYSVAFMVYQVHVVNASHGDIHLFFSPFEPTRLSISCVYLVVVAKSKRCQECVSKKCVKNASDSEFFASYFFLCRICGGKSVTSRLQGWMSNVWLANTWGKSEKDSIRLVTTEAARKSDWQLPVNKHCLDCVLLAFCCLEDRSSVTWSSVAPSHDLVLIHSNRLQAFVVKDSSAVWSDNYAGSTGTVVRKTTRCWQTKCSGFFMRILVAIVVFFSGTLHC